jgi:hypothetical protein
MRSSDVSIAASTLRQMGEIHCLRGGVVVFGLDLKARGWYPTLDEAPEGIWTPVEVRSSDYEHCLLQVETALDEARRDIQDSIARNWDAWSPEVRAAYEDVRERDRAQLERLTIEEG